MVQFDDFADALHSFAKERSSVPDVQVKKQLYLDLQDLRQKFNSLKQDPVKNQKEIQSVSSRITKIEKKFKPAQLEAVDACMLGNDVLVKMRSGSDRDLCLWLPSILKEGVTVVVCAFLTTLKGYLNDQNNADNIAFAFCGGNRSQALGALCDESRSVTIILTTPESFFRDDFQRRLKRLHSQKKLVRFIVDQAEYIYIHKDFRPYYYQLRYVKTMFPNVPIMGVMGDSAPKIEMKVLSTLGISDDDVIRQQSNQINIRHDVVKGIGYESYASIKKFIGSHPDGRGIIYCTSAERAKNLAEELCFDSNQPIECYTSDLTSEEQTKIITQFNEGKTKIVVATISFTSKRDDIRFVFWASLPFRIQDYISTSSQTAPGGLCRIYWEQDNLKNNTFVIQKGSDETDKEAEHLGSMYGYCIDKFTCRHKLLRMYCGKGNTLNKCNKYCDNCTRK